MYAKKFWCCVESPLVQSESLGPAQVDKFTVCYLKHVAYVNLSYNALALYGLTEMIGDGIKVSKR